MSDEQQYDITENTSEANIEESDKARSSSAAQKKSPVKSYAGRYYSVRGKHTSSKGFSVTEAVTSVKRAIPV